MSFQIFETTLQISPAEITSDIDNLVLEKIRKYENACFDNSFILKIIKILERGKAICVMSAGEGNLNIDVKFSAECYIIQKNDLIVLEVAEIKYKMYHCKAPHIKAVIKIGAVKYAVGDKIPAVVIASFYKQDVIMLKCEVFDPKKSRNEIYAISDTDKVPEPVVQALEKIRGEIEELTKTIGPEYKKNLKKYFPNQVKFKAKQLSALEPKFTNSDLFFVITNSIPPEECGYFEIFDTKQLKEFEPFQEIISGEYKYQLILKFLHTRLNIIRLLLTL